MTDTKAASAFFLRWLDRLSPPARIAARPDAVQDERDALMRAVLRLMPPDAEGWIARLTDDLDMHATTRAWPMVSEIAAAAKRIGSPAAGGEQRRDDWQPDPYAIAARDMAEGRPVSEFWIYGPKAKELLRRRLVSPERIEHYRAQWFRQAMLIWGRQIALDKRTELAAMHATAEYPTTPADLEAARNSQARKMEAAG
jgi:hypothetical protein